MSIGIYLEDGQGYAGGDGGTLQVTIHEDDGSEDHLPTGHPLASMRFEPGNPIDLRLGERMFDKPAELSAGRIYHAVFENVSRSPGRDFVSINALLVEDPGPGSAGPDLTEEGWALLLDDGSGWDVRRGYLPILQLRYGDGTVDGMAYIEVWAANAPTITATTPVRQVFTVSGPSRVVAALNLRATHVVGSGPLLVRIEGIDGRVSESYATLPTAGTALDWRRASFDPPLTLESGSSYHVLLVAPPGTEYAATALRKGAFYGFEAPAYFGDGHAEYWAGDTWRGYDQPGGRSDTTEGDLQFYFE